VPLLQKPSDRISLSYAALPTDGTRGGVLLAGSHDDYSLANIDFKQHSIKATIARRSDMTSWTITVVYRPQGDTAKLEFLQEIKQIKQRADSKCLILGDFNLICRASDKNNGRINRRLMSSFSHILDELELKELHLHSRRFTWTSATSNPTQTKIDHVFSTRDWELKHPHCHLQALGSSVSDHCPMILVHLFTGDTRDSGFRHGGHACRVSERQCNNPGRSQLTHSTRHVPYTSSWQDWSRHSRSGAKKDLAQ
jgi:hypothetical protein